MMLVAGWLLWFWDLGLRFETVGSVKRDCMVIEATLINP